MPADRPDGGLTVAVVLPLLDGRLIVVTVPGRLVAEGVDRTLEVDLLLLGRRIVGLDLLLPLGRRMTGAALLPEDREGALNELDRLELREELGRA